MQYNPKEFKVELGKHLKYWIKDHIESCKMRGKKVHRYQIAHDLGIDKPGEYKNDCRNLRRLEQGKAAWNMDQLCSVADAMKTSPHALLYYIEQIISQKK